MGHTPSQGFVRLVFMLWACSNMQAAAPALPSAPCSGAGRLCLACHCGLPQVQLSLRCLYHLAWKFGCAHVQTPAAHALLLRSLV